MNFPASQARRELSTLSFDPELTPGARNAVNVCLRIQPSEKVTVITDEATKEIAASLNISPHTVHSHIKHIYEKLQATDKRDAIAKARRKGLI